MLWLFWLFLALIIYVYTGYPLVLSILGKLRSKSIACEEITPYLTLFIPVYNEEKIIGEKIQNSLKLDYPPGKLEILVASDASNDGTNEIVRRYQDKGVVLFCQEERGGKNSLINKFIEKAKGEIFVFTDANSMFQPDALKKLVKGFKDDEVGCICGRLRYTTEGATAVGKGESLYFRYEAFLRKKESRLGGVVTASGAIYAIRSKLFSPLELDCPNDFVHPTEIRAKGYRVLYEPEAVALEKPSASTDDEFKRRVRIVTRGITTFYKYNRKYNLLANSNSFYFISHKLLRWFLPLFLVGLFLVNLSLRLPGGYTFFLYLQIIFYLCGLMGFFLQEYGIKIKIFYIPFYFCLINLAAVKGLWEFSQGKKQVFWKVASSTR